MVRAEVTDRGLAQRLGQTISFRAKKSSERQEGKLVYYPDRFSVLMPDKEIIPIKPGDSIGLRRGKGFASFDEGYVHYTYIGS